MNAVLICPSARPAVANLTTFGPLAAIPLLGESLVEYWLAHLALNGITEVKILSDDRPEQIAAIVRNGARWGLKAEVITESRELTAGQAEIKYAGALKNGSLKEILTLDRFPGSMTPIFTSYSDLFAAIFEWMPKAQTPDRVGMREIRPGIWAGLHTRISPEAHLHAPCWIGGNVFIGANAIVGPMTVIEDRSFIEPEAQVISSVIGPDTFVGRIAAIHDSIAWGSLLINWKSGASAQAPDPLLLSALRPPLLARRSEGMFARVNDLYARHKDDFQLFWKHLLMNKEG
jgi:NDP-sugar pyrophosphorylase family protein